MPTPTELISRQGLRCKQCRGEYSVVSDRLDRSVWLRHPTHGELLGELHLYCPKCAQGDSYIVAKAGEIIYDGRIQLRQGCPQEWLGKQVDPHTALERFDQSPNTRFRILGLIVSEALEAGCSLREFSSPEEQWGQLAGSSGIAVIDGAGEVTACIVENQS